MKRLAAVILTGMIILGACSGNNLDMKNQNGTNPIQNTTGNTDQNQNQNADENTGSKALEEKEKLSVSDFFPFDKDVHKKYKGTGNEFAEFETYVDYIRGNVMQVRNINPGTTSVNVYEIKEGELRKVFSKGETYYRYDYTDLREDVEILIKEPIKAGTSWNVKNGAKRSITALDKSVTTPSGTYNALEITTENEDSIIRDYYVKDIGLVKTVFTSVNEDFTVTSELEKLEKDVALKQQILFYFPDFLNDRIVFVKREVEMLTNQDMKYKFQKELKTIPEGSQLTKLLTPGVQINKITVDEAKNAVSVDFSGELVKEMNAGTTLEAMILKCLANTFGEYYQKQNVEITVDGKPYSSGHVMMKAGEYFKVETSNTIEYGK